jgi:5-methylcytosine-specific restriction protein A
MASRGGVPHELHDFSVASDGFIYGYLTNEGRGNLDRLGAENNATEVSGVTVIFISGG